jgi:hypothetical protein
MPQRHGLRVTGLVLVMVLAMALGGCQSPFGSYATVSGTVYGEQFAARLAGRSVPVPLRATITCNGVSTTSDSNGVYSFSVPKASVYTCTATAPHYSTISTNLFGEAASFKLTFGPKLTGSCDRHDAANVVSCGILPPATATLRGTVINTANDNALTQMRVQCWDSATDIIAKNRAAHVTITNDQGNYVFHDLPAGPWGCVAGSDQTLQTTTLTPGDDATLDISVCEQHCSPFKYHQGNVIHHLTAYLIFWLPNGHTFEPGGGSSRFEHLMEQYFQDVGGTPFYNILTQYYDVAGGPVRNVVTLGGSYVDTQPYPQAGTVSAPLLDGDIVHEINRVLDMKNGAWVSDDEHMVFVFTGYNVQECSGQTASDGCTFTHNAESDFCAYHSNSFVNNLIYAYIPVVDTCQYLPTSRAPNNDPIADAVISIVSHEQFEAVSNPATGGWFDGTTYEGEMADKCVGIFGPLGDDGGNVTLAHGHRYILQEEWSLHDQQCVLSYTPTSGT